MLGQSASGHLIAMDHSALRLVVKAEHSVGALVLAALKHCLRGSQAAVIHCAGVAKRAENAMML